MKASLHDRICHQDLLAPNFHIKLMWPFHIIWVGQHKNLSLPDLFWGQRVAVHRLVIKELNSLSPVVQNWWNLLCSNKKNIYLSRYLQQHRKLYLISKGRKYPFQEKKLHFIATHNISWKTLQTSYLLKLCIHFDWKSNFCKILYCLRKKFKKEVFLLCVSKTIRLCAVDSGEHNKLLPLFFVTPSGYRCKLVKYSFAHGNSTLSSTYLPRTDATKL